MERKILYIAGYGRSGSTLLDILLGNSDGIVSTGELNIIFQEIQHGYKCSCGESFTDCSEWGRILKEVDNQKIEKFGRILSKIDKRDNLFKQFNKKIDTDDARIYQELTNLIVEKRLKDNNILVDSSKTTGSGAFRPVALKTIMGYDVKIIHLKRNLLSIIKSLFNGSNRNLQDKHSLFVPVLSQLGFKTNYISTTTTQFKLINFIKGIFGYFFANRDARYLKKTFGDSNYIEISYEKLISQPIEVLESIEKKFNIDLTQSKKIIKNNSNLNVGHLVGGNRMASSKTIKFNRSNK